MSNLAIAIKPIGFLAGMILLYFAALLVTENGRKAHSWGTHVSHKMAETSLPTKCSGREYAIDLEEVDPYVGGRRRAKYYYLKDLLMLSTRGRVRVSEKILGEPECLHQLIRATGGFSGEFIIEIVSGDRSTFILQTQDK